MEKIAEILKNGNATIIDVRTPGEFMTGHVAGSINIPLKEISSRISEIKEMDNIILCCASGVRSSQAHGLLAGSGISCHDGGPWLNVNYLNNN
jgi:phage shock protein E